MAFIYKSGQSAHRIISRTCPAILTPIKLNLKLPMSCYIMRNSSASHTGDNTETRMIENNDIPKETDSAVANVNKVETVNFGTQQNQSVQHREKGLKADHPVTVDYGYFKNIIKAAQKVPPDAPPSSKVIDTTKFKFENELTEATLENVHVSREREKSLTVRDRKEKRVQGLDHLKPLPVIKSATLAPFINESEVLKKLLALGVDFSKVEKDQKASHHLLKCNWEADIQPYMVFLYQIGVADKDLGKFISKFPAVFTTPQEKIMERIDYFKMKKFSRNAISRIISGMPTVLSLRVKDIDFQLGYLQKDFKLTGNEVRKLVTKLPKLTAWNKFFIQQVHIHMKDQMDFNEEQIKQMILRTPRILTSDKHSLEKRFLYLHKEMGFTHDKIVEWSNILRTRHHITRQRHLFLKQVERAQYDPKKENYVTMKMLVTGQDKEFCDDVAKTDVSVYRDFLKTL